MRQISQATLAKLRTPFGNESIVIVSVAWTLNGKTHYYSDRRLYVQNQANVNDINNVDIEGKILELSNLENVVNLNKNGRSQSLTIKLDDTDGSLKNIIDTNDIHLRDVWVLQWFNGIPFSEAFIIFEGKINSPIVYKEGDRTLSFEVLEKVEEREVGFSFEQGQVDYISEELVGKPMPLGFGTNLRVPIVAINKAPTGITRHPIAFPDVGLYWKINQNNQKLKLATLARILDLVYAEEAGQSALILTTHADELQRFVDFSNDQTTVDDILTNLSELSSEVRERFESGQSAPVIPPTVVRYSEDSEPVSVQSIPYQSFPYSQTIIGSIEDTHNILTKETVDLNEVKQIISNLRSQVSQMEGLKKQYEDKAASDTQQMNQIKRDTLKLVEELARQEAVGQTTSVIGGQFFPRGTVTVRINGADIQGHFVDETFYPDKDVPVINPEDRRQPDRIPVISEAVKRGKFVVINPGAQVLLVSDYPIYHMVNLLPSVIHEVLAHRSSNGGAAVLSAVPMNSVPDPDYIPPLEPPIGPYFPIPPKPGPSYQIISLPFTSIGQYPVTYTPTMIVLRRALSTFDDGWDDQLYVSFTSSVGPNTVDILKWLINTYSLHDYDSVSFDYVYEKVAQYPSHFTIIQRKQLLQILEELAFQARLAIYLSSGTFYLKYLPEDIPGYIDPTTIETITENDIEYNSLEIEYTRTEDLVTKYVANYKFLYENKSPNQIVLRYNINKYDTLEKTVDYYAYNIADCVYKSLTFWIIRKGNTWKRIKLRTFLHKLNLESLDPVWVDLANTINNNISGQAYKVANSPVLGIVESAKYNSESNTIDLEIWLPVRIGEMDPYPFAYPSGVDPFFYFPLNEEINNGSVGVLPNSDQIGSLPGSDPNNRFNTGALPNRPNTKALDWGAANVSDNHHGRRFHMADNQLGTLSEDVTGSSSVLRVIENTDTGSGGINAIPGVVTTAQGSAYQAGMQIQLGSTNNPGINNILTILGVQSTLSSDGQTRTTDLTVNKPVSNITSGTPVLHNLQTGGVEPDISDDHIYEFPEYTIPDYSDPPRIKDFGTLSGAEENGKTYLGQVISGSGKKYQVKVWLKSDPTDNNDGSLNDSNDTDPDPKTVTMNCPNVDDNDAFPVDTWVTVTKIKTKYYYIPATWLDDTTTIS